MHIGLGPGHFVLDGNPAPSPQKEGRDPTFSAYGCGQTAGWIKMALGTEESLSPGDFLLDGAHFRPISTVAERLDASRCHLVWKPRRLCVRWEPSPYPKRGGAPNFWPTSQCGQKAAWSKTPLGMEVDLGPGHIVLDGVPAPTKGAQQLPPLFGPCLLWPRSLISATAELLLSFAVTGFSVVL